MNACSRLDLRRYSVHLWSSAAGVYGGNGFCVGWRARRWQQLNPHPGSQDVNMNFADEQAFAEQVAREAGAAVLAVWGAVREEDKQGSPVTEADRSANAIIVDGLRSRFPEDGILSEESRDSMDRLAKRRVWVVDPLDGTREFIDGIPEFAVMIGLAVEGRAVLGVVYCPATRRLYSAVDGGGAWVEQDGGREPLRAQAWDGGSLRMVGSRSHPDARIEAIQAVLGITDVAPSGSVGVKCARVAEGDRDLYVHPVPYLKEWDTCAPEVILREAGGDVVDCAGAPLSYNKPDPRQPYGILAGAPGVVAAVLEVVKEQFLASADQAVARRR